MSEFEYLQGRIIRMDGLSNAEIRTEGKDELNKPEDPDGSEYPDGGKAREE